MTFGSHRSLQQNSYLSLLSLLSACVLNLSLIGCYGVRGNIRDVYAMLAFGVLGYLLKLYKFNIVPIVLGMILGDIAEEALQQGLILYKDDLFAFFGTFVQRPICIALLLMMVASITAPFIMERRRKTPKTAADDEEEI